MSVVKPAIQFPVLIAYLAGSNNYTWLHFRNGDKQLLAKPISYLEVQPELTDFIRIHKTMLINPICVVRLLEPPRPKTAGAVELEGGVVLPVSRRRWGEVAALFPDLLTALPSLRSRVVTVQPVAPPEPSALPSIVVVTDNALSALLVQEVADQYWPGSTVHIRAEALPLTATLEQVEPADLPVFIMLDARTARQERLNALQHLKKNSRLSWIPVVLLVGSADEIIREGYYRQANSVIIVGPDHTHFVQIIKRIGQFWLETAALPAKTDGPV